MQRKNNKGESKANGNKLLQNSCILPIDKNVIVKPARDEVSTDNIQNDTMFEGIFVYFTCKGSKT